MRLQMQIPSLDREARQVLAIVRGRFWTRLHERILARFRVLFHVRSQNGFLVQFLATTFLALKANLVVFVCKEVVVCCLLTSGFLRAYLLQSLKGRWFDD